jgi:hypothetical protein
MKTKKTRVFLTALFVTTIGHAADTTYDPATGTVTIPEVAVNGKIEFVNAKLKVESDGTFSILSTEAPQASPNTTTYDPASNTVTIPSVAVDGKAKYANVKLGLNPDGTLSVLSAEESPVTDLTCKEFAAGTSYCSEGRFPTCKTNLTQANKLQVGMTYDEVVEILGCHGVLMSHTAQGGTSVGVYGWGTESFIDTNVTFVNDKVNSISGS